MGKRQLFSVKTPLGYHVALSRDRWRQVIRFKHPALAGQEKAIRQCLIEPSVVRASVKDADVHLYYRKTGSTHVCVVTAPTDDADYFVVTAYYTRNIKEGNELWKK